MLVPSTPCTHPAVAPVESFAGAVLGGQCRSCLRVLPLWRMCTICGGVRRLDSPCRERACRGCQALFTTTHRPGAPRIYCTPSCRRRAARKRRFDAMDCRHRFEALPAYSTPERPRYRCTKCGAWAVLHVAESAGDDSRAIGAGE